MPDPYFRSERCFRQYEDVIAAIVNQFPSEVHFKTERRKPSTDRARLVDAIGAFLRSDWISTVDRDRLRELRPRLEILANEERVTIRPRNRAVVATQIGDEGRKFIGDHMTPPLPLVKAAIAALELGAVSGAIRIKQPSAEVEAYLAETLPQLMNVATTRDGDSIILI